MQVPPMSRRWYSKRHYDRVLNRGTGNPPATDAEQCKTWRDMIASHPDRADVREVCEKLIREHGGEP